MPYDFFNSFTLRTPKHSLKELELFLLTEDDEALKFIIDFFNHPTNNNALLLASIELHSTLHKLSNNFIVDDKKRKAVLNSLVKYFLRMTTRATPFGLFAGINIGSIAERTNLVLDLNKDVVQINFRYPFFDNVINELLKNEVVFENLRYSINNTIYKVGQNWRYIEYKDNPFGIRNHKLTEMDESSALDHIFSVFQKHHFLKKDAITELCKKFPSESAEDIDTYLKELIDNQIIIPETFNGIYDENFFFICNKLLEGISPTSEIMYNGNKYSVDDLLMLIENWKKIESNKVENYDFVTNKNSIDDFNVIQVNGVSDCTINRDILINLKTLINVFSKCHSTLNPFLNDFKKKFLEKFEDNEIPILQVFDPDIGINFRSSILTHDNLTSKKGDKLGSDIMLSRFHQYLLKRIIEAKKSGQGYIEFKEADFESLCGETEVSLGQTITCMAKILSLDGKEILYVKGMGDTSSTCVLTRFFNSSVEVDNFIKEIIFKEEEFSIANDYLSAELVHLPGTQFIDILKRPTLRNYFIPFVTNVKDEVGEQLELQDILVSIKDELILLRSKKNNKYINVKLSTAHNYTNNSLPLYQFLAELQTQNALKGLGFDWSWCGGIINHIPRIFFKGILMNLSTWIFIKEDLDFRFKDAVADKLVNAIEQWRHHHLIPRYVTVDEEDNELFIDFEKTLCLDLFKSIIKKKRGIIKLTEFVFSNENSLVRDTNNNGYAHEVLFALYNTKNTFSAPKISRELSNISLPTSKFSIGSEWVYLKIYCEAKSVEKLLNQIIRPLVKKLYKLNYLSKWFFIRYGDPENHIRLRFKAKNIKYVGEILLCFNSITQQSSKNILIKKVIAESYTRELKRYGVYTVNFAENIFCLESDLIIELLNLKNDPLKNEDLRYKISLYYIDKLLNEFGMTSTEKEILLKAIADNFLQEFGNTSYLRKNLMSKFKAEKQIVYNLLKEENVKGIHPDVNNLINKCIQTAKKSVKRVGLQYSKSNDFKSLETFKISIIHMFMNRLFASKNREQELTTYNILWLYYRSLKF